MAEEKQQQSATQSVAGAANAALDVAKAAGKAAAGNVAGAVVDLLKNPQIRNAIIAIILGILIIFTLIGMSVGSAITAAIQWFVDNWSENWAVNWEEQGINSRGNVLYLYSIGGLKTMDKTIVATIGSLFETDEHRVNGEVADNSGIEGGNEDTDIDALDYEQTFAAIQKQEALTGEDGALRKRLDLIKNRIQQRGSQIKAAALSQFSLETIGVVLAASISNSIVHPFLYNGIDLDNSSISVDTSAFEITDIQALKILAAFCVQHECDLSSADLWEIMDYCGWYGIFGLTNATSMDESIYNVQDEATFAEEFLGYAQAGETLDPQVYKLEDLMVPRWSGTCVPQWCMEEVKQIKDYKKRYDLAVKNNNTELLQTMYPIPTNKDGNIDFSAFDKISNNVSFGIIDTLYKCTYSTLTISRSDYCGADEVFDEAVAKLLDMLVADYSGFEYEGWADMVNALLAQWTKASSEEGVDEDNLPCKENGNLCKVVLHNAGTPNPTVMLQLKKTDVGAYVIKNYHTNETSQVRYQYVERPKDYVYQSEHGLYVPYLKPDSYYQVYYCPCFDITPVDCGHNATEDLPSHYGECFEEAKTQGHEHQFVCIDVFDTYFSGTTQIDKYQAYQLELGLDISFAAQSVDDIAIDLLGLWPGDLRNTITDSANRTYAYGYIGKENLRTSWTDTFTDANGQKRTMTLERQYGYQYEYYQDYILGVADELELDTTGVFIPDNGYGDTMVSVARKEYQYASSNHIFGGDRYWKLAELGSETQISDIQRLNSWSAAFVLSCAYQCGYVGSYGCFGDMREGWPLRTSALWNKLVSEAGADLYETKSFAPRAGDLIFFAPHEGSPIPTYVGIVTTVHNNGDITVISGDMNNKVAQTTYHSYKIGYPCKINDQELVISSYIRPHYPNANITDPMYLSYNGADNLLAANPYITSITPSTEGESVLLAGYPRFRLNQLYDVVTLLRRDYPEYYSDELLAAAKSGDQEKIIRYWYDAFLSNDTEKVKQDQLTIAAQLFVKPIVTHQQKANNFNWAATKIREEIMLLIISTSSNEYELNKVFKELTLDLADTATDEELLIKFMTDNYLGSVLEAHQDDLWYGDPDYLRQEWLAAASSLLNALREKHIITAFMG